MRKRKDIPAEEPIEQPIEQPDGTGAEMPEESAPAVPDEAESIPDKQAEAPPATDALADAAARIAALEAELASARLASRRREVELRCARLLRERGIPEEMAEVLLAPGESEVEEEILLTRVTALTGAVEAAAVRTLQARTSGILPGAGTNAPLTAGMIRDIPLARLAEIMR